MNVPREGRKVTYCPCCWSTLIDRVTPIPTLAERQVINMMTLVIETIEKKEEAKAK